MKSAKSSSEFVNSTCALCLKKVTKQELFHLDRAKLEVCTACLKKTKRKKKFRNNVSSSVSQKANHTFKPRLKKLRNAFTPVPMTPEIAKEKRAGIQAEIIKNTEINEYIDNNPIVTKEGNLGKPQDPYRWGYYGSSGAEYDFIRKNK